MARTCALLLLVAYAQASSVSPVQKVIELIGGMRGKVTADLAAEEKAMEEYSAFCDDEATTKGYQIKDSTRHIADLGATIEDSKATITQAETEIVALGAELANKDKELAAANSVRSEEHATFQATEKELVNTVDSMSRAILEIKKGMSFMQVKGQNPQGMRQLRMVATALSKIADAAWVTEGNRKQLSQFLQSTQASGEDSDLSLKQPQAKTVAYESKSGGIVETIEDMKSKAEEALSDSRRAETKKQHSFKMVQQSLESSIKISMEKKSDTTSLKEGTAEELEKANGELVETTKTKAADVAYVASLHSECQMTAQQWSERQGSAKDELGALDKATEILTAGVKVFVQVSAKKGDFTDSDEDDKTSARRAAIVTKLKTLARTSHSFALMEMATAAGADPFGKIRGLIEDMIAKLITEANEEATQKAFCDEEQGKSKKSLDHKQANLDKLTSRIDKAAAAKAQLEGDVKELESEVAEIDASQGHATAMRTTEHNDYAKSSADFKASAEATERAIVVLKEYYEGSLLQVSAVDRAPQFGSAKGDSSHAIIEVLEMAAEDFTKTYTEIEAGEMEAVKGFTTLTDENKVSKAQKLAEAKAKQSEVKSLTVALSNNGADRDMVNKELDAVLSYLEKLRPQCESKAMSYEEKKARREAEIEGLKEALSILDGQGLSLIQRH